jgi:hypothetical protein
MRRLLIALVATLFAAPSVALAQSVRVEITPPAPPPPPTITFAAPPPLVVVQPGVQVVPDQSEEIFYVDGWYWVRRGPHWYRTQHHGGGWVAVAAPPPVLVKIKPGKYKHWKGPKGRAVVVAGGPPGAPPVVVVKQKGGRGHGHGRGRWK